jgi:hypothetical protein
MYVMHFIFKDISEKILYLTDFKLQPVCSPPGIFDLQASSCKDSPELPILIWKTH